MKLDVLSVFESAGWAVIMADGIGNIRHANKAAVEEFGPAITGDGAKLTAIWSEQNGRSPDMFFADWEKSPEPAVSLTLVDNDKNTSARSVLLSAAVCGDDKVYVLQFAPAAFPADPGSVHKQKLECALQLARTVALDFNNALTSVLGHTSLVLGKMEAGHPWRAWMLEVEKSAAKAAEIASDLGTFSSQEKEAKSQPTGNLNQLVQRAVQFFQQNGSSSAIAWNLHFDRKLFTARFDEAKMQQAFAKILENSVEALTGPGRITVVTRNIESSKPIQDANVQLSPGTYVCGEVTDNGCGIPGDVIWRVFDPFFTTKANSNHRGLGLAWVYGIVTNHGGGVAVSSEPGEGTCVRVYLPAEKKLIPQNDVTNEALSGKETVLMVDDEDLLLTMGQTVLSSYGYHVLTANSGAKALEILSHKDTAVDLVITDLVMPSMSGRELVEHIRGTAPGTPILCTSGYVWPSGHGLETLYLQKPFTTQELLHKVREALPAREQVVGA